VNGALDKLIANDRIKNILNAFAASGRTGRVDVSFNHKDGQLRTCCVKTVHDESRSIRVETTVLEMTLD